MGISAQVVKKNPAKAAKPRVQEFCFATRAGIQERYSSMSHYIKNIYLGFFNFA
jgi:hypothetical protein